MAASIEYLSAGSGDILYILVVDTNKNLVASFGQLPVDTHTLIENRVHFDREFRKTLMSNNKTTFYYIDVTKDNGIVIACRNVPITALECNEICTKIRATTSINDAVLTTIVEDYLDGIYNPSISRLLQCTLRNLGVHDEINALLKQHNLLEHDALVNVTYQDLIDIGVVDTCQISYLLTMIIPKFIVPKKYLRSI